MATQAIQNANVVAPGGFTPEQVQSISRALNPLLADVFALYLKTKNFHWHMSGPHFRDYHLLLDEQATQIFAISDDIAERVRKVGGNTLKSIGEISKAAAYSRQRKGICARRRNAARTPRRQPGLRPEPEGGARDHQRSRRLRHHQPH